MAQITAELAVRRGFDRRRAWIAWGALLVFTLATHLYPIRDSMIRRLILAEAVLLWAGALALLWRVRPVRWGVIALTATACAFLLLPGRACDRRALQAACVRSLRDYDGVRYVWGGENRRGIDCSGLIRCGMVDAYLRLGLKTLNPSLLRGAYDIWWNDTTAAVMGTGYSGRMRPVMPVSTLNEADNTRLQPGDLAVTGGGTHVMAYLGEREWIEADPNGKVGFRVVRIRVPTTESAWFDMPADIMRWKAME